MGGTATGTSYTKTSGVVPAGEVWVLQGLSIRNNTRATTGIEIYINLNGTGYVWLLYQAALARYIPALVTGQFTLGPGSYVVMIMKSTVVDDVIRAGITGYKMDIAM